MDTWPDLLARTYDLVRVAVTHLDDTPLACPTPCAQWTVRELVAQTIDAIDMFAAAAGAPAVAGPVEGRPVERFEAAVFRNLAAWGSLADPTARLTLPVGAFPAEVVAGINQLDSLVHGWDIGVSLGLALTLPDDLSDAAMRMAQVRVPIGRGHVFGAEVSTAGTSPGEKLLAFCGRDPTGWSGARRSA